eukprot:TRINITY_DN7572_c0_g1_i1.p1 TRINITY_DN7572_c0_g1~~TRINITY_DN7572_c0_g1_i1.p1  ORF type:complete len:230 (-),score=52.55 TRINITY_DN7572_c0_g1_i1:64-753(-)
MMNSLVRAVSSLNLLNLSRSSGRMCIPTCTSNFHTSSIDRIKLTDSKLVVKRKVDPVKDKAREEKRRKRLVKALKKMEKKERQPKPLSELEVPNVLYAEAKDRARSTDTSEDQLEERYYFLKDWQRFAHKRHQNEILELDRKILAQQEALDQLRHESLELYLEAIQFDPELIPFQASGPTLTPAIKDYLQDGDYTNITKEYKVVYQDTEAFLRQLTVRKRGSRKKKEDN